MKKVRLRFVAFVRIGGRVVSGPAHGDGKQMGGKETGWIVATVVTVAAFIGLHSFAGRGHEIRQERDAFRDSLAVARDQYREAMERTVEMDSAIARLQRESDSAQVSRPPVNERYRANVAHFDTVGISAAFDSLSLPPIGY